MSETTMIRYAMLLRGVNVGGNSKIAMADLRSLLTELGFQDVKTLLQSGNAVFLADPTSIAAGTGQAVGTNRAESARRAEAALAGQIEEALAEQLSLRTRVLLRTHEHLTAVIDANPFPSAEQEPSKHLVQFLYEPLTAATRARIAEFDVAAFVPEDFRVGNDVIYFRFPDGMGRSKLAVAFGKHVTAKMVMTGRNWNTVRKLHDLTA
jgi:uncharacterized protein (DUF1697 family)